MELSIHKFDIGTSINSSNFMIIGSRRNCQQQIIYIIKNIVQCIKTTNVICITDNEESQTEYDFLNNIHNSDNIDEQLIEVINIQKKKCKKLFLAGSNIYEHPQEYICIIIDIIDPTKFNLASLKTIIFDGRLLGIKLIVTCQYILSLGPELRANIDYLFLFGEKRSKSSGCSSDLKRTYLQFFGFLDTFNAFIKLYEKCESENSWCIVLDRKKDTVFYYNLFNNDPLE